MRPIFRQPIGQPERLAVIRRSRGEFPGHFPTDAAARFFLFHIIMPPSRRWAFMSTGKNAGTSTLRFLFRLEFGVELTVRFQSPTDINPDAVVHQLPDNAVFSRALYLGLSAKDIAEHSGIERLCIVRNPYDRAVSAFTYFCKSNELAKSWFLGDRLRINATVGFDWQTMPYTVAGFRRFLRYIELERERVGVHALDGHWRPQSAFIIPELYRPTLVGRMEDLPTFYKTVAERLRQPLPDLAGYASNRQEAAPAALLRDEAARRIVERVFRRDFEIFGY